MPPPPSSFDLARHLADLGWQFFPLAPTGKRPLAKLPRCTRSWIAVPKNSRTYATGANALSRPWPAKADGYLAWSGRSEQEVLARLVTAGLAAALVSTDAERLARRSLANGIARPLAPTPHRSTTYLGRTA